VEETYCIPDRLCEQRCCKAIEVGWVSHYVINYLIYIGIKTTSPTFETSGAISQWCLAQAIES